jgi:nitrate/nitrite-specific signal transduction histidine kinase
VVAESLTNAAKHAAASLVNVFVDTHDATLRLLIRDDGIGGADFGKGSGLIGLQDRVEVLGGHMEITSPRGAERQCISASHSAASDADCKKPDAQFGHQLALLAIVRRNAPQAMTFGQD